MGYSRYIGDIVRIVMRTPRKPAEARLFCAGGVDVMPGGPMTDQGCHGKLTCNRAVTGCHRLSQAVTAVTAVTGCHMLSHDITSVTGHPKADCFCIVAASCIFTLEYLTPKSAARAIRHGAPRNALENQAHGSSSPILYNER